MCSIVDIGGVMRVKRIRTKFCKNAIEGATKHKCTILERHTLEDNQYKYLLYHAGTDQIFTEWGAGVEKGQILIPGSQKHIKRFENEVYRDLDRTDLEFEREVKPPGLRYRMDFYNKERNICVEADELRHNGQKEADKKREEEIKKAIPGIRIFRVRYKTKEQDLETLIKNL